MQYLKQYGARRTGTNYIRALLETNFNNVTVLMHTLGGKHHAPVNLQQYLAAAGNNPLCFVEMATNAAAAENALGFMTTQQAFVKSHASALTTAVIQKELHFLISIKDPYSWIHSTFKNALLRSPSATDEMKAELQKQVKIECRRYNTLYGSYRQHALEFPAQTTMVPYDKLIANPFRVLLSLQHQLNLSPVSPAYSDINTTAFPTDYDSDSSKDNIGEAIFEKDYYLQQKYLADLSPLMIATLEKEIDWEIAQHYGYQKHQH